MNINAVLGKIWKIAVLKNAYVITKIKNQNSRAFFI